MAYTASGFQFSDTAATVLTGSLARAAGETVSGSPYAIGQGTLTANSNYTIHFTGSSLSITPATPAVTVSDPGGTYTGSPIAATATVTGVNGTAAPSLEGVTPTLTYYAGTGTSGTDLGSAAPSAAGTYTVVARFPGSADYAAAQSEPATFVIAPAAATITADVFEQLTRLRTGRHLRRDGEFRRRHAGRDGHLLRRHHPAGHRPAGRLRPGRADDLDPEPGLARDHGDLQRRHRLPRREVGHDGRVGQPGGHGDRPGAARGAQGEEEAECGRA